MRIFSPAFFSSAAGIGEDKIARENRTVEPRSADQLL
jgi:hypothetical protein